jgi:pentatricopeptide repeat protein
MNVAIKCGQLQKALEVYGELLREGCVPNVVTYNTLIDVHGKTGQWAEALKVGGGCHCHCCHRYCCCCCCHVIIVQHAH